MTKCPYVPPHPWNVDFPHTMRHPRRLVPADVVTLTRRCVVPEALRVALGPHHAELVVFGAVKATRCA